MKKTDNRHYNTRSKRGLSKEMDLWIAFKENNSNPLLIGKAISQKSKGDFEAHEFELYYHPFELSGRPLPPFRLIGVNNEWNARYETIQQAKYYLKKQYYNIKWIR